MTAPSPSIPLTFDAPRAELARLCRQIWIAHGRTPARSLEADFLQVLSEIHQRFGPDSASEDELWETVRAEGDRVATAEAVAEILLPRLSSLLKMRPAAAPAIPSVSNVPFPEPAPRETAAAPAIPGIADLIEGMLDQQRNEARPPSSQRS